MKLSTSLLSLVATGVVALPKPQSNNLPAQSQQGTQQLSSSSQLQQQQWQQQPGSQTQETFVQSIGPGFNILLAVETSPKGDKAIVSWAYGRSQCVERQLVSKGLNFCGKWLEFNRVPELDPGLQATGDWEQVYVTFVGCDDRSRNGDYSGIYMAVFVPGEYEENFSPNTQGQLGGGGQFSQGSQIGPGGQNTQQYNPNQQLGTGSNTQQFNPQQQGQFNPNQQQQQQQQGQPASGQFNTNQMQGNQMQGNQNPNAQALGRPTQPNTNQFQPPQQQQGNFAPSQNSQLMQNGQPQPQALGRPAAQLGQQPSNQLAPQNLQQNQPVQQAQAQPNQLVPNSNLQQGSFGSNLQQNTNNQLQPGGQPGTVQQNQFGQNIQQGGTPQSFQQNAVPQQQQPGQQQPSSQFSSNALPQTQQIQPGKPNPNKPLSQAQLRQLPKSLPIGLMKEAGLPTDDQGSSSSSQGLPSQGLQNSQLQQSGSGSGSDSDDNSDPIDPTTGQAASTNWMGDGSSDSGNEFGSGTDVGFGGGSALDWYGWVGWYVEFYECNSDRELHGCNYEGDDNTDLTTFLSCGDYAYTADRTPNDDNDEGKSDNDQK